MAKYAKYLKNAFRDLSRVYGRMADVFLAKYDKYLKNANQLLKFDKQTDSFQRSFKEIQHVLEKIHAKIDGQFLVLKLILQVCLNGYILTGRILTGYIVFT